MDAQDKSKSEANDRVDSSKKSTKPNPFMPKFGSLVVKVERKKRQPNFVKENENA